MLLARCLILSSTVLQAQFLLYQKEPFRFVDIGCKAKMQCTSTEIISPGTLFSWYKRRENEISVLVEECGRNDKNKTLSARFVCRVEQQRSILEISSVQTQDSAVYLCAVKDPDFYCFSNGSFLIVGDSYTQSTRVILLLPPPPLMHARQMACVVHGVSSLVQVSWEVPGGLQPEGLMLRVRNSSGLFSFVSILRISTDSPWGGKNVTCEVRFNSSGPRLKETVIFPAPLSTDSDGKCLSYVVPTVAGGLLVLLILLVTFVWIRFCPSRHGVQLKPDEAPSSEMPEEGICYAELDFASKSCDRNKKRKQGRTGRNVNI